VDTSERLEKWLIQLNGDDQEFKTFADFLSQYGPDYEILKQDGVWNFFASRLTNLQDPAAVLIEARKIIKTLKGYAKLKRNSVSSIEVGYGVKRVFEDHEELYVYPETVSVIIEPVEPISVETSSSQVGSVPTVHQFKKQINHLDDLATNSNVSNALSFFSLDSSWPSLYKAYSDIWPVIGKNKHEAESKIVDKGWATPEELDRFGHFSNFYDVYSKDEVHTKDVTGIGSRHGEEEYKQSSPYKEPIMHLPEAEALIRKILIGVLEDNR
jgi:hypothetical protein